MPKCAECKKDKLSILFDELMDNFPFRKFRIDQLYEELSGFLVTFYLRDDQSVNDRLQSKVMSFCAERDAMAVFIKGDSISINYHVDTKEF